MSQTDISKDPKTGSSPKGSPPINDDLAALPPRSNWQEDQNYLARIVDDAKTMGTAPQTILALHDVSQNDSTTDSSTISYEIQLESLIGSGSGILMGVIIHWFAKSKYSRRRSLNPLYRNFKVLGYLGNTIGNVIGYSLPLPSRIQKNVSAILSDIFCFVFALFAFPYWLIRQYVMTTPDSERNKYAKVGTEGWSKYGKTLLVYGLALGQCVGVLHSHFSGVSLSVDMALAGGLTSLSVFIVGMILIPVINKITSNKLQTEKDTFRNNYVRTGMTLGAGIGVLIGFALFPVLGPLGAMALGSAVGSLIGGAWVGIKGKDYSEKLAPRSPTTNEKLDSENSWDYATRSTFYLFASLGTIVGFFIPVPGGAMVGAALGAAIGGVIGWCAGYQAAAIARKNKRVEKPANSLPWTQRTAMGSSIFAVIGGIVGMVCGLALGGPAGALIGAMLGYAAGSFIGAVIGILYDPKPKQVVSTTADTSVGGVLGVASIASPINTPSCAPPQPGFSASITPLTPRTSLDSPIPPTPCHSIDTSVSELPVSNTPHGPVTPNATLPRSSSVTVLMVPPSPLNNQSIVSPIDVSSLSQVGGEVTTPSPESPVRALPVALLPGVVSTPLTIAVPPTPSSANIRVVTSSPRRVPSITNLAEAGEVEVGSGVPQVSNHRNGLFSAGFPPAPSSSDLVSLVCLSPEPVLPAVVCGGESPRAKFG